MHKLHTSNKQACLSLTEASVMSLLAFLQALGHTPHQFLQAAVIRARLLDTISLQELGWMMQVKIKVEPLGSQMRTALHSVETSTHTRLYSFGSVVVTHRCEVFLRDTIFLVANGVTSASTHGGIYLFGFEVLSQIC